MPKGQQSFLYNISSFFWSPLGKELPRAKQQRNRRLLGDSQPSQQPITWNKCTHGGRTCPLPRHGTSSGKHSLCLPSRIFPVLFWETLTLSCWLAELKEHMRSHGKQDTASKGPHGIRSPWNTQRHTSLKSPQTINAEEGMKEREPSCTAGGNVNWCSRCGK